MGNFLSISKNKCIKLKGSNRKVLEIIEKNRKCKTFFVKRKISNRIIYMLLQMTDVEKIYISRSVAKQLPKKSIDALVKTGVKVEIVSGVKRGRKNKYDAKKLERMLGEGKGLHEICREENMPIRTLYYYKRKLHAKMNKPFYN